MLGRVLEELAPVQCRPAFRVGTAGAQGPVNGHMLARDRLWFFNEGHVLSLCSELIFGLGMVGWGPPFEEWTGLCSLVPFHPPPHVFSLMCLSR